MPLRLDNYIHIRTIGCLLLLAMAVLPIRAAGTSSLIEAIKARDWVNAKTLLAAGADVSAAQPDGATALHWAAYQDSVELVDALLHKGAKPSAADEYGETPLNLACANGSTEIVERLLAAGAD